MQTHRTNVVALKTPWVFQSEVLLVLVYTSSTKETLESTTSWNQRRRKRCQDLVAVITELLRSHDLGEHVSHVETRGNMGRLHYAMVA